MNKPQKIIVTTGCLIMLLLTIPVMVHEYVHYVDYKDYSLNGKILFLSCQSKRAFACYNFSYYDKYKAEIREIDKTAETKAVVYTIATSATIAVLLFALTNKWVNEGEE